MQEYNSIVDILHHTEQGIHVECTHEQSELIFQKIREKLPPDQVSYIVHTDQGYEKASVKEYLKFFEQLADSPVSYKTAMEQFDLEEIKRKKLRYCSSSELMRVHFARISLMRHSYCFIENPLTDIDSHSQKVILDWIEKQAKEGIVFITTSLSLRHALMLPGTVFYRDDNRYIKIEQNEQVENIEEEESAVQKIAAKSENGMMLFDPKDIDYIESMNKSNFLSVRGSAFHVNYTMDQLEEMLDRFGFFRCHRSYIVNVQKVEKIEKWTKNSYSLRLNNETHTQVPLSKGRIQEMKDKYHW